MDIVNSGELPKINTLEQLSDYLQTRQGYFISALERVVNNPDYNPQGWQSISRDTKGNIVKKKENSRSVNMVFTGQLFCVIASRVVSDAISDIAQKQGLNFRIEMGDVNTNYNGEDWDTNGPKKRYLNPDHTIVKVTDRSSNEVYYFDPTYAQINHKYAGKILCIPKKEFIKYYKDEEGDVMFSVPSLYYDEDWRNTLPYGVDRDGYEYLVSTLI